MSQRVRKFGNDANNRIYIKLDTDRLELLEKELSKQFVAQVGVLGVKAEGRTNDKKELSGMSNADIGLVHEKGSPLRNIPRRSFLEVPLTTKMPGRMAKLGNWFNESFKAGSIELVYKRLAKVGEDVVLQAFPTSGYGKWPALGTGALDKHGRHTVREFGPSHLIKSGQLSQSIASRVVTK